MSKRRISHVEIKDITEWDVVNFGKAIKYIDSLSIPIRDKKVLELGAHNGGMSLYFGKRGAVCICTDLEMPGVEAINKHKKWHVEDRIKYEALDATQIPDKYREYFDIITFKSVLGGGGFLCKYK